MEIPKIRALNEQQMNEIKLAKERGNDGKILKQHPEWHPTLMNYYWNAENSGQAESAKDAAGILATLKVKEDEETGMIGSNAEIVQTIFDLVKMNIFNKLAAVPTKDGYVDSDMLEFKALEIKLQYAEQKERLLTGRISLPDSIFAMDTIMAEGNSNASEILGAVQSLYANQMETAYSKLHDMFDSHTWSIASVTFALDDMNIRGQQLLYVWDYCNGAIENVVDKIMNRDKDLVDYVNHRTALAVQAGEVKKGHVAVTGGASFAERSSFRTVLFGNREQSEWFVNKYNCKKYILNNPQTIDVDYSTLDIKNNVPTEIGIEIAKHHGFKMVYQKSRNDIGHGEVESIIMCNPSNGDLLNASSAQKNDMCYGGVEITAFRNIKDWHTVRQTHCLNALLSTQNNICHAVLKSPEGIFKKYKPIEHLSAKDIVDWSKIEFGGLSGLPLPRYIPTISQPNNTVFENKKVSLALRYMLAFYDIGEIINTALATADAKSFNTDVCPVYKRLEDEKYKIVVQKRFNFWNVDEVESYFVRFRMAASYLDMPAEYAKLYFEEVKKIAEEISTRRNEPEILQEVSKLEDLFVNGFEGEQEVEKLGLPPLNQIGVELPWNTTVKIKHRGR